MRTIVSIHHRSAAILVAVAALIMSGCSDDERPPKIAYVERTANPSELWVSIRTCNAPDREVEVITENATEVVLRVTSGPSTKDDCADGALALLEAPLGDRIVRDDRTQNTVEIYDD